jgi:hypothetical protein
MVVHLYVVRTVLQSTKLISGQFCVYLTVLLNHLKLF